MIDNAHVQSRGKRRIGNGTDFSLAIDEAKARAEGLHATRHHHCTHADSGEKQDADPQFFKQSVAILPGPASQVKNSCVSLPAKCVWNYFLDIDVADYFEAKSIAALISPIDLPFQ